MPGYRAVRVAGLAAGITVRSRNLRGQILGAEASWEERAITELAEQARREIIKDGRTTPRR